MPRGGFLKLAAAAAAGMLFASGAARAEDPDFLSVAGGIFHWEATENSAAEFRVEYRSDAKFWVLKPFGGLMATTDGGFYGFAGVLVDVYLGDRFVVTPSFAPGYYEEGNGIDLGDKLEFRSQIEVAYRFDDRSRLGVAVSHMSNAGIGDSNPGTESVMLYYSIPFDTLSGR